MIDRAVIDRILPRLQSVFQAPPAEARLLPEGRMAGPMPWVIAIIMFLTVLAAATGISLARSAKGLDADLAGRLTIQIVEANAARRPGGVRPVESVEDVTEVLGRDAFASVCYVDLYPVPVDLVTGDRDAAAGRTVSNGVLEQVAQHLAHPVGVGEHLG